MAFVPKKQAFDAQIREVTVGLGERAITLGGQNVLPFHTFDGAIKNPPRVGVELTDLGLPENCTPGEKAFYEGCTCVEEMALRAGTMEGADFLCLHFVGADPNGENKSIEDCVRLAKRVADVTDLPLVIMGCRNPEKDAGLLGKVAQALAGKNVLLLSARDENCREVSESVNLACHQKLGAESSVDINLAKQLNTVITQMKVPEEDIVMNLGSAAVGYGFEYLSSTLDRVRDAALRQSDDMLQMPVIAPVSDEAWSVKESVMDEAEMPQWGSREERGIGMEISTAAALLAGGSDAVILRHPEAVRTVAGMIRALLEP